MKYCVEKGMPHDEWLSWSPESRAKHIAMMLYDAEACQLCGTAQWEWDENPYAYEPEEVFCKGCYIKAVMSEENKNSLPGTTVNLVASTEERQVETYLREKKRAEMSFSEDDEE